MGSFEKNKTNMNFHILGPAPPPPKTYEEQNLFFSIHNMSHPLMSKNVFGPTPIPPLKIFSRDSDLTTSFVRPLRTSVRPSVIKT